MGQKKLIDTSNFFIRGSNRQLIVRVRVDVIGRFQRLGVIPIKKHWPVAC